MIKLVVLGAIGASIISSCNIDSSYKTDENCESIPWKKEVKLSMGFDDLNTIYPQMIHKEDEYSQIEYYVLTTFEFLREDSLLVHHLFGIKKDSLYSYSYIIEGGSDRFNELIKEFYKDLKNTDDNKLYFDTSENCNQIAYLRPSTLAMYSSLGKYSLLEDSSIVVEGGIGYLNEWDDALRE